MRTEAEQREVIEAWMTAILRNGGIERYDDLHIDRIDEGWTRREHWLRGGLEAFRLANGLRDLHGLSLTVALAYSLESGEEPRGMNFGTSDEFQAQLDWSPPSIYLFHPDREPWMIQTGGEIVRPIDARTVLGTAMEPKGCYYMEFKPPDSVEYSRSVFVAG